MTFRGKHLQFLADGDIRAVVSIHVANNIS
jgi:hypothetical protein